MTLLATIDWEEVSLWVAGIALIGGAVVIAGLFSDPRGPRPPR